MTARLGLPIRVDNGTVGIANNFVIPPPCLGIYRLADGAQDPQARKIIFLWWVFPEPHERANGRRGSVEDRNLVALDHIPVATYWRRRK